LKLSRCRPIADWRTIAISVDHIAYFEVILDLSLQRRFEAKIDGPLWLEVIEALPDALAEPLAGCVKSSPTPMNQRFG
jgi:hypothetical protein